MARLKFLVNGVLGVLALGCAQPAEVTAPLEQWRDKLVLGEPQAGGLYLVIRQAAPRGAFKTLFLRELDWERAEAELTHADAAIAPLTRTVDASLDAANMRRATLSFSAVKPAANYSLTIRLKRRNRDGLYETIASGANTGFTISPGANAVTVALTASAQGELLVDVAKPSLLVNTLTSEIATQSAFSVQRVAGDDVGGNASGTSPMSAAFREISGLEVDAAGTLYLADAGNHQIRRVPATGATQNLAGAASGAAGYGGDGAAATDALLDTPRGLTRDPASGNIFFCDAGNGRVRAIDAGSGQIFSVAGGGTDTADTVPYALDAQLDQPFGIAADQDGNVFVTERGTGRVRRIAPGGALTTLATLAPGAVGPIAIDRTHGLLWVGEGAQVRVISGISGAAPTLAGAAAFSAIGASGPVVTGLAFDQIGTLYVAQSGNNGLADARIWRLAMANNGLPPAGRVAEAIAGTGAAAASAAGCSVPAAAVANATGQLLAGKNWCALFVDLSAGLSGTTVSGLLYSGNSYDGAWGQVLRLTPSGL